SGGDGEGAARRHRLDSGLERLVVLRREQDRPALDAGDAQHPVLRPWVLPEPSTERLLGRRVDDVERLLPVGEWAAEQDEALVDQRVHEVRVLRPLELLAHVLRPVPRAAALDTDDEQLLTLWHARHQTTPE